MSKNKDAKRRAKRFREESLRLGAWQGCAGRGGDGEDQMDVFSLNPKQRSKPI